MLSITWGRPCGARRSTGNGRDAAMSSRSRPTSSTPRVHRANRIAKLAIAAIGGMAAVSPALAAPGDLDPTFGKGGRVIVDIENDNDSPAGILLQPDGKILVGRSNTANTDDFS